MYSIFHPLDVNERLPRELVLEGKRHRLLEIRHLEIAAVLYLPALMIFVIAVGSFHLNPLLAFAVAGLALVGFLVYTLAARLR
jgi:hypothetical protein